MAWRTPGSDPRAPQGVAGFYPDWSAGAALIGYPVHAWNELCGVWFEIGIMPGPAMGALLRGAGTSGICISDMGSGRAISHDRAKPGGDFKYMLRVWGSWAQRGADRKAPCWENRLRPAVSLKIQATRARLETGDQPQGFSFPTFARLANRKNRQQGSMPNIVQDEGADTLYVWDAARVTWHQWQAAMSRALQAPHAEQRLRPAATRTDDRRVLAASLAQLALPGQQASIGRAWECLAPLASLGVAASRHGSWRFGGHSRSPLELKICPLALDPGDLVCILSTTLSPSGDGCCYELPAIGRCLPQRCGRWGDL